MTLVSSGILNLKGSAGTPTRSIEYELEGAISGDVSLLTMLAAADPPYPVDSGMTEFYGYSHGPAYGDMYGQSTGFVGYIKRVTHTGVYTISLDQSITLEFTADQDEDTRVDRTAGGAPFRFIDSAGAVIYRRAKGTSDSWVAQQSWGTGDYTSQAYSCDFSTYDYQWDINDGT